MRRTLGIVALICCALVARGEERPGKLWRWSAVVVAGEAVADAQSSWGRQEANPLLRASNGAFNGRGIAIKGAITGGSLLAQYFLVRHTPRAGKYAAAANFAIAGVLGGAAIHNHRLAPARPAYLLAGR